MAQRKLPTRHSRRALILGLGLGTLALGLTACAQAGGADQGRPVGLTLLFMNVGRDSIGVKRFDPDGQRGPVPGALGVGGGGAQMTFMPGDSKRGMPRFVEVEWVLETPEARLAWKQFATRTEKYSSEGMTEVKRIQSMETKHTRRIDLTLILNPELLARIRANPKSGNVKLTVTFNGDQVSIEAQAEKLR